MVRLNLSAHATTRGDIAAGLGEWLGEPGSGFALEGIAVAAAGTPDGLVPPLIEYQLAYSAGLVTPWTPMPHYCGSKGLGLAVRGIGFRAASRFRDLFDCVYAVAFVDGSVRAGLAPELCSLDSGAPVAAISLALRKRQPGALQTAQSPPAPDAMAPPPGGESPLDDPTIQLRLLSPAFASAPPALRNPELIPLASRQAMGVSWCRPGFRDRTISLRAIDQAYVVHEGLALDQDLAPIPSTRRLYADSEIDWARDRIRLLRDRGELRRLEGTSLLCKARANNNYGHYLVEMFSKAWIGRQLFGAMGVTHIMQQNDMMLVVAESLLGIGINPHAIAWTSNEPVVCDRLLLLDGVTYHGQYQSPLCAQALRDLAAPVPPGAAEKIFVSRRARTRPLLNEDRVEAILRQRGFVVVEPGRMMLRDQIAVFKGARIVVGALGAALTNIAFCAAGTKIVALTSASFPDTFFWFLSLHGALDYSEIRCTDVSAPGAEAPWDAGFSVSDADLMYLATL